RVYERSFFCRTCHSFLILFAAHTASKSFAAHAASKSTFTSPVNDHLVCALVVARLVSAGRLSPGRDRMASTRSFAFTTAVRMVDRVHHYAAVGRADAQPARASSFADADVLVVQIAHLTDGRHACHQDFARL